VEAAADPRTAYRVFGPGDRLNRVCARIAAVTGPDPEADTACVTLTPEAR
jgi:hypothetical protein